MTNDNPTFKTIAHIVNALGGMVDDAQLRLSEAAMAIHEGDQNQAIGAMLDLDRQLEDAAALYRAVIALHRQGR